MSTLSSRRRRAAVCRAAILATTACVAPTTQQASLTKSQLVAEQHRQEELAVQATLAQQQRLDRVAWPILRTALPLCAERTELRAGISVATVHDFPGNLQGGARRLGLSDTLMVTSVAEHSPAHLAGVRVGDRLTHLAGVGLEPGRHATGLFAQRYNALVQPPDARRGERPPALEPLGFAVRRGASPLASYEAARRAHAATSATETSADSASPASREDDSAMAAIRPDTVCAVRALVVKDDTLNAWTDGKTLWVTTAMLRFVQNDDELAAVVAHEVAHAVERHIDARKANAVAGAFVGVLLDVAAATQGVNTQGQFTKSMSEAAAMSFSHAFENEADYTGAYLLARIGRPVRAASGLWRRMAEEAPGAIQFASGHPTTAERFVRIEQAAGEIEGKRRAGEVLLPNRKERSTRR
jgi:hypothetical protein